MPHSSCRSDTRNKDKEREQLADRKLLWRHLHLANDTPSTYYTCKEELDAPNTLVGRTHAAAQQAKQQAERIVSSATSLSTSCPSSTEVTSTISHASVCNDRTRSSVPSAHRLQMALVKSSAAQVCPPSLAGATCGGPAERGETAHLERVVHAFRTKSHHRRTLILRDPITLPQIKRCGSAFSRRILEGSSTLVDGGAQDFSEGPRPTDA